MCLTFVLWEWVTKTIACLACIGEWLYCLVGIIMNHASWWESNHNQPVHRTRIEIVLSLVWSYPIHIRERQRVFIHLWFEDGQWPCHKKSQWFSSCGPTLATNLGVLWEWRANMVWRAWNINADERSISNLTWPWYDPRHPFHTQSEVLLAQNHTPHANVSRHDMMSSVLWYNLWLCLPFHRKHITCWNMIESSV